MVTKHVFWGKYFGKSVFGHFFCPISTFPKYFPGKKLDILYNIFLGYLKRLLINYNIFGYIPDDLLLFFSVIVT